MRDWASGEGWATTRRGSLVRVCAAAAVGGLAGCGPHPSSPGPAPARSASSGDAGFASPPNVTGAVRSPDGRLSLEGLAPSRSTVRLVSPETGAMSVLAAASGAWRMRLPPSTQPRMFALMAESQGRTLRAEGAIAAPPAPAAPALVLRGGAAALALGGPEGVTSLAAVDFDAGGGVGAAGRAAPGSEVRLVVDEAAAGVGRADARGRFSLLAVRTPLAPGAHAVRIETPQGAVEAAVITSTATPLGDRAYQAQRIANGWRIDWTPPGGGVQSVAVLDPVPAAR